VRRRCVFLPRARADLREIGRYIARDNGPRAISFVEDLRVSCRRLAQHSRMGRARPNLRSGLRSFAHDDYVIFYEPLADGVLIVRILHGARDARPLL
jgi:toxin ParE1/3/4